MAEEKPLITPEVPKSEPMPDMTAEEKEKAGEAEVEVKAEQATETTTEKYKHILSKIIHRSAPAAATTNVATDANALAPLQDAQSTVQKLVSLAETKGVAHAVAVAQKLNELYVLDKVHDRLVDELTEALTKKGLIQAE